MRVKFNSPDEFTSELHADPPPSKLVRLTRRFVTRAAPGREVFVVAGFVNKAGELVELSTRVGEDWGQGFDSKWKERSLEIETSVEAACKAMGVVIRPGSYEV